VKPLVIEKCSGEMTLLWTQSQCIYSHYLDLSVWYKYM